VDGLLLEVTSQSHRDKYHVNGDTQAIPQLSSERLDF
jgi:hypothetical protein